MEALRVGVLGYGTVGRGTVRLLLQNKELIQERVGMPVKLVRIATRDPHVDRGVPLGDVELTGEVERVIAADDIDVVVELIGGLEPARTFVTQILASGKHVVTANKALIAIHGNELFAVAREAGKELLFEAAVAGAVPVIKAMRESLAGNRIKGILGILNGTCNYILTQMRETGEPFETVLAQAQALGYAEADPSFDVDGIDAAHKLTILSAIAFGTPLSFDRMHVEGIRAVSAVDIAWASEMGYRIKLLCVSKYGEAGLELRVHPTLVPAASMLGAVEGVFNAVFVDGDFSGTTLYYGRGAGEEPTASAVVGDLVDLARNLRVGADRRVSGLSALAEYRRAVPLRAMRDLRGEYYLRVMVVDKPGVLADITAVLKKFEVSIDALHQKGRSDKEAVPVVMVTHETSERRIRDALREIGELPTVREKPHMIRIEHPPA